ncbi:5-formaminoimidazole-4-carboxamide-1-(beta)-D-ribofuranosyl 5'-monophosphate synthetase [uncultured archaeon]|nr:5-formaminoimidazole-4-carboxamide-1-(beta)-D-ribofuranosyl 5'-monophosphate synthetase [uncultured archaeon]
MVSGGRTPKTRFLCDIDSVLTEYNKSKIHIATIGRHSALNIFKGAHDEGFPTVCICKKGEEKLYKAYGLADEIIHVEEYERIIDDDVQDRLRELNSIVIPHGSFNAYIEGDELETKFCVPMLGNRTLLQWERSRDLQTKWLQNAGLTVPKIYEKPSDINQLVLVKFPGARGGKGYFIADSEESFNVKMDRRIKSGLATKEDAKRCQIQEYIIGVSVYPHYFYSPLKKQVELLGVDKRYEASVDGIGRIPAPEQLENKLTPSFTVVGNFPLVVRESLLPEIYEIGEKVVEASHKIAKPGAIGPFCLETIVTENLKVVAFEISARIVAGCNAEIGQSPYAYLLYNEVMYMGKRIAREIKEGVKQNRLGEVVA